MIVKIAPFRGAISFVWKLCFYFAPSVVPLAYTPSVVPPSVVPHAHTTL